ncbi:DUF4249 domain-containing protein [Chitinophaga polysaccharea]|uniref:DUF4249 domain-containing protein n=1 Tax=Chitinophaga TaxID=79328 RepID=UPI0014554303|nr:MULTISPECIES: DUF4249 domain-containing protein [Chitinophaga]NLR60564.1 DUF4249 domain-containing protein [Chitinophaga polysaccharea]NLU90533.1 DUF4249 domain-containing protein [Chitinophaga sp. Ak27]
MKKSNYGNGYIFILLLLLLCNSCEKNIDLQLDKTPPMVVVEAYINNSLRTYNYVIIGKTVNFNESQFANTAVEKATVTITEGVFEKGKGYQWNPASKVAMKEGKTPGMHGLYVPGAYFDPKLTTDSSHALLGKPGKSYLLEITAEGRKYTAITTLPIPVPIDSLTNTSPFKDDSGKVQARLTVHYTDPDTLGNAQIYYWGNRYTKNTFGWGALSTDRYLPNTDELVNGQAIHITHSAPLPIGDTAIYYLVSVERPIYNFWDSFNKARLNSGPFSTPVVLKSNIKGSNVVGCFSGFSVSSMKHVMK